MSRPHALSVAGVAALPASNGEMKLEGAGGAGSVTGGGGGGTRSQSPRRTAKRQDSKRIVIPNSNRNGQAPTQRRRFGWKLYVLVLLGLVVLGTFIVLRTAVHFFGTHTIDFISPEDIIPFTNIDALPYNSDLSPAEAEEEEKQLGKIREKIPRIVHQTWKTDVLPEKWDRIRKDCMEMLPDFEFKLWSDATAREFIASEFPSFLAIWDSYPYNIQRADAIRYFVLHRYGGIYMDLDIGCRAHPGPLLHYETILPVTKPVGVSNDLMFSAPKTPFMDLVVESLETYNHEWLYMPYPTVMFSTGPMFVSALYSSWCRILGAGIDPSRKHLYKRVKILSKALYGKNITPEEAPHSFFYHYYGSSWHAGDAGVFGFLGKYGYRILLGGSALVFVGFCYVLWSKRYNVLPSPRLRKVPLGPFDDFSDAPLSPMDHSDSLTTTQRTTTFKKRVASFANYFSLHNDHVKPAMYSPLATHPDHTSSGMRQRSNTADSDSLSLHSIHHTNNASPPGPPPKRKPRGPPQSTRPHSRQRSRDIERGSPMPTPAHPHANGDNNQAPWLWPEQSAVTSPRLTDDSTTSPITSPGTIGQNSSSYFPMPTTQTSPHRRRTSASPPAMRVTAPSVSNTPPSMRIGQSKRTRTSRKPKHQTTSSSSSSGSSSPVQKSSTAAANGARNASPNRLKAPINGSTFSLHERKHSGGTTDGDVSASELADRLTDLAPVATTSARPGPSTPREPNRESHYMMRKRSLSSEGERFQER